MRMQQRRKTAANWTSTNEVLLDGEIGLESDTGKWKTGDGTTAWNAIGYQPNTAGITAQINAVIGSAPGALDTLDELAAALGDDANFASTVTTSLAGKANTSSLAAVATSGSYTDLSGTPTLGTAATHPATDFDAAGAASTAQAYAIQRANHTGTQSADTVTDGTTNKAYTATEKTKLAGIATAATANSPDATLLARANHTGTQAASTITGLATVATSGLKADVGLGSVDNTADSAKPVSTAQAAADAVVAALAGAASPYVPASLHWFANPMMGQQRTLAKTLNQLELHVFYSGSEAITIDKFDLQPSVAAGAGGIVRIGVYTITDQVKPFKWIAGTAWATLATEVGTLDVTSTGQKILTPGTAVTIAANTWFAVGGADQVAASTRNVAGAAGANWATKFGQSGAGSYGTSGPGLCIYQSGVSGALPSTFTPTGILTYDSGVGIHRSA